jgi:hypothetical protein
MGGSGPTGHSSRLISSEQGWWGQEGTQVDIDPSELGVLLPPWRTEKVISLSSGSGSCRKSKRLRRGCRR